MAPSDRAWLKGQLDALFAHSAESLVELDISDAPPWSARAVVAISDGPRFELTGSGGTAEEAFADFLARAMQTTAATTGLMRRAMVTCWVCRTERERIDMEAAVVGGEIWWLCDRCQQRRANAARIGVIWPTDYDAWVRRWRAEQRTAGRDDAWLADVEAAAQRRFDVDPFLVNRMKAVLAVEADRL